jgi:hypothetical protein
MATGKRLYSFPVVVWFRRILFAQLLFFVVLSDAFQESKLVKRSLSTRLCKWPKRHDDEITTMENELLASAQARTDSNRILRAFDADYLAPPTSLTQQQQQWKIALAASFVGSSAMLFSIKNVYVAGFVFVVVFIAANGDPLQDDSLAGALARLVGRQTLRSVEASQPKVRALARAVITGEEEIVELNLRIQNLQDEVESLRLWKERRLKVDDVLNNFTLDELKDKARRNKLEIGGTKAQVLMRLVEAEVLELL